MTSNDKVIVSHPTPEDLQINEEVDQTVRWNTATKGLDRGYRNGQVSSGIYRNKRNNTNNTYKGALVFKVSYFS